MLLALDSLYEGAAAHVPDRVIIALNKMLALGMKGGYVFREYRTRLVGNRRFSQDVHRFSWGIDSKFEKVFILLKRCK